MNKSAAKASTGLPKKIVCPAGGRWTEAAPSGEDAILFAGEVYEREDVLTDDFAQKLLDAGHIKDAADVETPLAQPPTPNPTPASAEEK